MEVELAFGGIECTGHSQAGAQRRGHLRAIGEPRGDPAERERLYEFLARGGDEYFGGADVVHRPTEAIEQPDLFVHFGELVPELLEADLVAALLAKVIEHPAEQCR